jgi:hypothetical protein
VFKKYESFKHLYIYLTLSLSYAVCTCPTMQRAYILSLCLNNIPPLCLSDYAVSCGAPLQLLQYMMQISQLKEKTVHVVFKYVFVQKSAVKRVLLHSGGSCNACTIKRSIILQCIPRQST